MRAPAEFADITADVLARIRSRAPRVHCITNSVAQAYTANMLLEMCIRDSFRTVLSPVRADHCRRHGDFADRVADAVAGHVRAACLLYTSRCV